MLAVAGGSRQSNAVGTDRQTDREMSGLNPSSAAGSLGGIP